MTTEQLQNLRLVLSEKTSLVNYYDSLHCYKATEAIANNHPTIKQVGPKAKNFIEFAIADLRLNIPFYGETKRLVDLIYDNHQDLHLPEIKLFIGRGMMGLYGQTYGTANTQTVMLWLNEYKHETSEIRYWYDN